MSKPKARIRIRLSPNIRIFPMPDGAFKSERVSGPDEWIVTLTVTTPENHTTKQTFRSHVKDEALRQAYECLDVLSIPTWFPLFEAQQVERWKHLFDAEGATSRFTSGMLKVLHGEYSRDEFISLWQEREKVHQSVNMGDFISIAASRPARVPEDNWAPDPPKRWSFWDWFRK